ncbi:hypothetical protein MPER_00878, partial [Moniliophthora perniciosa FA553]
KHAGMNSAFAPFAPLDAKNPHSFGHSDTAKLVMGILPMGTGDWHAFKTRGLVFLTDCRDPESTLAYARYIMPPQKFKAHRDSATSRR